jgi:hypothetical protein
MTWASDAYKKSPHYQNAAGVQASCDEASKTKAVVSDLKEQLKRLKKDQADGNKLSLLQAEIF